MKGSLVAAGISLTVIVIITSIIAYLGTMTSRACLSEGTKFTPMGDQSDFSESYEEARRKFLDAVAKAGGKLESIEHPEVGPAGRKLFIDVAYFGAVDNTDMLVVSSGTHGVEGFAGSGIQTGLLRQGFASKIPQDVSLIMIHSINPYGMAHLRRVTEDNIDLNRNFRNHATSTPPNLSYDALANAIAPVSISFFSEVRSWWQLLWFRITEGKTSLRQAVSKGQYTHPAGLFYGGRRDAWSTTAVHTIIKRYLGRAKRVIIVDVHTGLGEYGNAELILNSPVSSPEYQRAVNIWGKESVKTTVTGGSVSVHLDASLKLALMRMLPEAEVTAVSLEFGTLPPMAVFKALRAENWLHHQGGSEYAMTKEIKACLLRAFYPDDDKWRTVIWEKGQTLVRQASDAFNQRSAQ